MVWEGTPIPQNGRVTSAEVLDIFKAPSDVTDLTPFITAADLIIDNNLIGKGLSDATLKEISRWLSAHFATIRYQALSSQDIGKAKEGYIQSFAAKRFLLLSTDYGQQAVMLDTTGTLKKLSKDTTFKPSIQMLGQPTVE